MNIRSSLYRFVAMFVVIPFLLFSLLITNIYSERLDRVISDSLSVVADAQISEMTNYCEQQRDYLTMLGAMEVSRVAMNGGLNEESSEYLNNILYSYVSMLGKMNTLAIIDKNHQVVACSDSKHEAFVEAGFDSMVQDMGNRSFYISDVLSDRNGNKTLVEIARFEVDNQLLGYVLGELDLDFYQNMREQAKLWNEATFYLIDGKHQIISAGTSDQARSSYVTKIEERTEYTEKYNAIDFEKNPQGSFGFEFQGKEYITYYSNVKYTDWRVMLTVNMDVYRTERAVYMVLACSLVFLCVLLALWIGWFASKRIVYPIHHISSTLKGIQQTQDYSLRVDVGKKDEIGNLAEEVNELLNFIETENLYKTQQQRLLQEKAGQDALTKVLNKERINQYLTESIERQSVLGGRLAVLFIDIDDFKAFNTRYGHSIGDQVLTFLASLLKRETKSTVGRVGGDEFVVVIEMPDVLDTLDECLSNIEKRAEKEFIIRGSGEQLSISCCIGAVMADLSKCDTSEITMEHFICLADSAMYEVKNNGKHGHVIREWH